MNTKQTDGTINFAVSKTRVETGHRIFSEANLPYSIGPFVNIEEKTGTISNSISLIKAGTIYITAYFNEAVTDEKKIYLNPSPTTCGEYLSIEIDNNTIIEKDYDKRWLWELFLVPITEEDEEKVLKLREIKVKINFNEDLGEPRRATRVIPT